MAGVPVYDAPQEQLRPLGAPDLHSVASPEVLGGAARNVEKLGKGLAAAGDDVAQVAIKLKQRDDADQVFRAETALKDAYLKQEQEWRKSRQGRFAQGLTQDADKWWNDQIQQQVKGLKSADAQRIFAQRAAGYREQGLTSSSHWEQSQLVKSEDDSYKATQSSTVGMAVAAGTPAAVDSARDELRRKTIAQGAIRGWTPEIVQAETQARLTDLHTQMIQGLAQNNPGQAAIYFEKFKDEIDGAKHAELGKFAQQASATHLGEVAADEIWTAKGPKADADPVELDKMEAAAREKFKNDDYARKAAIEALRGRATAHNSSQSERKAANTNSVMDAVRQGAGINQIRRMAEFNALPGDEKAKIEEHIETRRNILEARDSAGRSRLEREQLVKFSAAYHAYSDPDTLASMTRAQVQALEPTIGREYADRLLTKWETIGRNEGKLTEARIDNDAFKAIVRDFGFDPDKKLKLQNKDDAQYAARLGSMRDEVERQIGVEQKAKNRQLTREEKDTVARKVLSHSVLRGTSFLGIPTGTEAVPAASIIPADLKNVKVPSTDREAIKAELLKRNKPAGDEDIARWYLLGQKKQR